MGILAGLWRQAQAWDGPTKLAFALAGGLLVLSLLLLSTAPELRTPALIATAGLLMALQLIALWGNRHMVTPYTQAQRHFLAGDMERARDVLLNDAETRAAQDKKPTVDSLVLLGNIYRNLGKLDESLVQLQAAVTRRPTYHFALYGLGRSLLAHGDYTGAIDKIEAALRYDAPEIARLDVAHAYYRHGTLEQAAHHLQGVPETDEAWRQLLLVYLRHCLLDRLPPEPALIAEGVPFWAAEAERFAETPYGDAVQADVVAMRALMK